MYLRDALCDMGLNRLFLSNHSEMKKLTLLFLLLCCSFSLSAQSEENGYYAVGQLDGNVAIRVSFDYFLNELKESNFPDSYCEASRKMMDDLTRIQKHSIFFPITIKQNSPPTSFWFQTRKEWEVFACFDALLPKLFKQRKAEIYDGRSLMPITDYEVTEENGVVRVVLSDGTCVYEANVSCSIPQL